MEIRMDSMERAAARNGSDKQDGKRRHAEGATALPPIQAVNQAKEELTRREKQWRERLRSDPASFAEIERQVHAEMRFYADVFMAALLAKVSSDDSMADHVSKVMERAEGLGAVGKKNGR